MGWWVVGHGRGKVEALAGDWVVEKEGGGVIWQSGGWVRKRGLLSHGSSSVKGDVSH